MAQLDRTPRNRLAATNSPYLLAHADNPVDWYPWGPEALSRAMSENKPILLSIGYATCHWCHVMEHESFRNSNIAAFMNDHFVCIKVDREERPDIDAMFMTATVALCRHGGWPMTVFLTPAGEVFFAGTYFPPVDRHGHPGFLRVLTSIAELWAKDPARVVAEATNVNRQLKLMLAPESPQAIPGALAQTAILQLRASFDSEWGGFDPAPALEPQLGAFYWITPIPQDWPKERVESKLREYNNYGLRILTIHEAIPGHYVQAEYASTIEPMSRRMLRAIYGSGVYVEGWAVYATAEMLKAGYLDRSPELKMQNLKWELRAIANTILDIKYQTMGLTDDEAMTLMMDRTFQEREEAVAKVQRAKLSSCQLTTYFTGYSEWKRLRAAAEVKEGKSFNAGAFNERALREGALPMKTLERVLGLEQTAARQ